MTGGKVSSLRSVISRGGDGPIGHKENEMEVLEETV